MFSRKAFRAMGGEVSTSSSSSSAGGGAHNVDVLVSMGFRPEQAAIALQATNNNVEAAVDLLTEQKSAEERQRRANAVDQRLSARPPPKAKPVATAPVRTTPVATVPVVARPAVSCVTKGTFVDILTPISDQPETIDTLHYVLRTIRDKPTEPKYRSLQKNNARFQRTLAPDRRTFGQVEMVLKKIGFDLAGEWFMLSPSASLEPLIEAVKAIEYIQSGPVYVAAKRNLEFERAIELSKTSADEEELKRRRIYAAKLPAVPPEGAAGTTRITVVISEGAPPLTRRFASDDQLIDIINWIGSERSVVCGKILEGAWSLVDETFLQKKVLDVGLDGSKSLQALALWPSATLHVRLNNKASSSA